MKIKRVCPVCEKPYTPTSQPAFPKHGRVWVNRPGGGGWAHCEGSGQPVTEFTPKWYPKRPEQKR